jgi:hypothetical protein
MLGLQTSQCTKCNQEKLLYQDFRFTTSSKICRKCLSQREKMNRHKREGTKPQDHWRFKSFYFSEKRASDC